MVKLTVLYGHPADPEAFDRYYDEVHIPLARKMQGWTGWTIGKCEATTPGEQPPYYMIVALYAESRASAEAILASPEGQAAVADVPNFATGGAAFMFDAEQVIYPVQLEAKA
ncbi:EthD family reductase [Oscillochloris sp. ZM17-4]|uniref:EthD family reductase n=1 Tax=Oscillochloris sp. ZM17-4 TaxID=2866714 RepID=UPI001C72CDF7|nr:EthD family reductase [Oscillochloris sp. ZM17-4]MBX0329688.1 EthD family reductase [Oscillochloris sp. ZM17-4]